MRLKQLILVGNTIQYQFQFQYDLNEPHRKLKLSSLFMFFFLPFPPGEAVIGRFTGGVVENQPVLPAFTERFTKEFRIKLLYR